MNNFQVCKKAGQEWIEDPTNFNHKFARNRIRQVLADPLYGRLSSSHALVKAEIGMGMGCNLVLIRCTRSHYEINIFTPLLLLLTDDARRQIHPLIAACRQTRAMLDRERDGLLAKIVTISKVTL